MATDITQRVIDCSIEELKEMQCSVAQREDASETEGKCLQDWSEQLCMVQIPGRREHKKHD